MQNVLFLAISCKKLKLSFSKHAPLIVALQLIRFLSCPIGHFIGIYEGRTTFKEIFGCQEF